jgi:hypothetical protein
MFVISGPLSFGLHAEGVPRVQGARRNEESHRTVRHHRQAADGAHETTF